GIALLLGIEPRCAWESAGSCTTDGLRCKPPCSKRLQRMLHRDNPRRGLMPLSPLLDHYDNVVLDLDGCVWVGDTLTRGAPEAISALRAGGKALAFMTNDARRSPEDYVRKLWSLGLQASLEEVVTVGGAIQHVLAGRQRGNGTYVIGSEAIFRHVAD